MLSQPGNCFDVEVVGGLIEHNQVMVAQQQFGQGTATTFTAGQPNDGTIKTHPGEQHFDNFAGARVGCPLVVRSSAQNRFPHGVRVVEFVALPQIADVYAARRRDPTAIDFFLAGQDPQQGGLAVPVATNDADALSGRDAQRHFTQQRTDAVRLRNLFQVDQIAHRLLTDNSPNVLQQPAHSQRVRRVRAC